MNLFMEFLWKPVLKLIKLKVFDLLRHHGKIKKSKIDVLSALCAFVHRIEGNTFERTTHLPLVSL